MWGSAILEVAVGVLLVFLLVSTMCTAVREGLEAWLKTRAAYLEHGIRELLHDRDGTGLAAQLYTHPLIFSLYSGEYTKGKKSSAALFASGRGKPSYIPAHNFAMALLDIAARGPQLDMEEPAPASLSVESVRAGLAKIENPAIRRVLSLALETANDDVSKARAHLEAWFDSGMDRVSGWYKRSTFQINLGTAVLITLALNIDTFAIATFLYQNDAARNVVVAQAGHAVPDGAHAPKPDFRSIQAKLDALELPIGWDHPPKHAAPDDPKVTNTPTRGDYAAAWSVVTHVFGLLVTVLAALLGAPFWFDVLNKVMVIRSTVKPHEKSREEGSEDRREPAAPQVVYLPNAAAPTPRFGARLRRPRRAAAPPPAITLPATPNCSRPAGE